MNLNEKLAARRKELAIEAEKSKKAEREAIVASVAESLLDKGIEQPRLRIITGLFVGICSSYVIVSILEVVFGFYGTISNILLIILIITTVKYSLKKGLSHDVVIMLHKFNYVVFSIGAIGFFLFNQFGPLSYPELHNPILANRSIFDEILWNVIGSALLFIPGGISLMSLVLLRRKHHKTDFTEAALASSMPNKTDAPDQEPVR